MYARLVIFIAVCCAFIAVDADPFSNRYNLVKSNINTLLLKPTGQSRCNLIAGLSSIAVNASLTVSENITFQAFVTNMETTIINNASITSNQTKLDMCAAQFKTLQVTNSSIWTKIQYVNITMAWGGSCDMFVRMNNENNFASSMVMITATDATGNCKLFDALIAACGSNATRVALLKAYITSTLKPIVKNKGMKAQPDIMIAVRNSLFSFFGSQDTWLNDSMSYALPNCSFAQFSDVAVTYSQQESFSATLSGSNTTCPFILAMNATLSMSNYTVTQKAFIKQQMTYFQQQFATVTSATLRMQIIMTQFSACGDLSPGYFSLLGGIPVPAFGGGSFFDLIIVGGCQSNNMPMTCGCPTPYATTMTTMMPTTEMPWVTNPMHASTPKCSCSCQM